MGIYKMNKRIIEVYNSLKVQEFTDLMNEVAGYTEPEIIDLFTNRWYIWNIIRNKDFYKLISTWLINCPLFTDIHFLILSLVITTANTDTTRITFVKSIMKKRIILTIDTIKYIEDIQKIFEKEDLEAVVCDEYVQPFVDQMVKLETDISNFISL